MPHPLRYAVFALVTLMGSAAQAQNPDVPLKGRDTSPNIPPSSETVPEKVRPSEGDTTGSNLSDKLQKNDGAITRPSTSAPGMVVTPPDTGGSGMPVIKPSDLPGREPGTEAK